MLPDIDGYEVLHRLRAAKVDTPILILSGLTDMQHKVKGLGIGAEVRRVHDEALRAKHRNDAASHWRIIFNKKNSHS